MAEVVEFNIEEMIPELELMEKLQVLTKSEIRNVMRKRKQFEYRLQRISKNKDDLLRYIQFEMDLLKMIRQKILEKGLTQKKNNLEYTVINHINKLFNLAIRRFASDVRIWLSYIKFCKQVRFYTCVSRILDQLLELHGADKPSLFKLAAQWEFDECHSIERARKFIHQGLHTHKDSKMLFTEGFRLELAYAKLKLEEAAEKGKLDENGDVGGDPVLKGQLAEVIYDSAIKKINDVTFLVDLLNIAEEYKFTSTLQNKIIEGMKTKFPNEEVTWDTLARRELELGGTFKERIEKCITTYQSGLDRIHTQKMWGFYLDCVLELNEDPNTLPNFKKNCLKNAFDAAHKAEMLTERHYLMWIRKVEDVDTCKVLRWGTERLKDSIKLWSWRLRFYLSRGDEVGAVSVFREAISNPDIPDQASLWFLLLKYYQMTDPSKGENLWKEGVNNMAVGAALKGRYVEWLAVSRGILAARRAYETLAITPPFSLDLHVSMSRLEDAQPKLSLKHARMVYETALTQFGESNTDVWMWYVRFEEKYGEAKHVPQIYDRAMKTLKAHLVDVFVSEFNLNKADTFSGHRPISVPRPIGIEPMDTGSVDDSFKQPSSSLA
uniref:Hepatocellular carcinoma-associated antigen n=1 Tax=Riptortus pedestris TaxID=329032 RepID=R4WST9_RIPPE|nr:hepatocellular carcinoma-associated antigen [Riptortus pedestris]